ncbi:hypothetical protein [Streptomyces rubradiris]|uniref:Uncharacterized protein n=1 Tax=Streptomyces rubradiris TaxID=285531 RepID=A0ABQ3RCX9_STRRR|nr:hypothetical protein [Streptomyces rubradiris]GHG94454.1 hypothetical protein GCM10018792_04350 [Streptomyces rubradiris]GHI53696.1 hypothetical protein Srubr_35420 [Streptomyces rubradiris]
MRTTSDPRKAVCPEASDLVTFTTIDVRWFGVRYRADGRTGGHAWQIIRRRDPWLAWTALLWPALLQSAVITLAVLFAK